MACMVREGVAFSSSSATTKALVNLDVMQRFPFFQEEVVLFVPAQFSGRGMTRRVSLHRIP